MYVTTPYLKQTKMIFKKNKNREKEGKTGPVWGLVSMGVGRRWGKCVEG
jgi:hypothetical protein